MIFQIAQYAAAVVTIATAVGLLIKWIVVKPIKAYIDIATYPIAPHSNGGKSLPDAIKKIDEIAGQIRDLDDRLNQIENLVTKPTRTKKVQ